MSKVESIKRYILIITKLQKQKHMRFKEIEDYLKRESEYTGNNFLISKRTFQRDIQDIQTIFGIVIKYDTYHKAYYIHEDIQPERNQRFIDAFLALNALNVSNEYLQYIHFEKFKSRGCEFIQPLVYAMERSHPVSFIYHKFTEERPEIYNVEPYTLKEFEHRWYLIARDTNDGRIKVFGLDRIKDLLNVEKKKFQKPEDFDINEYFKHTYGIIREEGKKPYEIILSFHPSQKHYLLTQPLHESQEVVSDTKKEFIIKLKLHITLDFIMKLCSYGSWVKVVKPARLVHQMKREYQNALKQYE